MLMHQTVPLQALFPAYIQPCEETMKETLIDIVCAIVLGLIFAGFALAYFDVLTY